VLQVRSRPLASDSKYGSWKEIGTLCDARYVHTEVQDKREYQIRVRALQGTEWAGPVTVSIDRKAN
jgi:hypothetical protein